MRFSCSTLCLIALMTAICGLTPALAAKRPNILFAISDDQSYPYSSIYGSNGAKTPAFDRVAREGVLFNNAYCASPGCSPCRAALLTGRQTWQIENAGTHASSFPQKYVVYPDMLEQAGYKVGYTGKGWGPGNYKISGRTRNPAGPVWSKRKNNAAPKGISKTDYAANFRDFLNDRKAGEAFCFWYGAHEPHRSYLDGIGLSQGKQRSEAFVPSFLPDTPEIRSDILDYCVEVEWFDTHLGRMLTLLEEAGELDNTLIVVTADNGMPFPRAKANCYDFGIHAPLAIRWPARVAGGRTSDDLVSFVDFAPTFLEAAGLDRPNAFSGKSLMNILTSDKSGIVDADRTRVFSARDRHSSSRYNNWCYPIRAMRTRDFLYVRNFEPTRWPAGHPAGVRRDAFGYYDIDACPSKTFLWDHRNDAKLSRFFHLAVDKRPAEELFDLRSDPGNLKNLAESPAHAEILKQHRTDLETYLRETQDPRVLGRGDVIEAYKRFSHMRSFPSPEADSKK